MLHNESLQTGQSGLVFQAANDTLSYQDKTGQLTALARFDTDMTADILRNSLVV